MQYQTLHSHEHSILKLNKDYNKINTENKPLLIPLKMTVGCGIITFREFYHVVVFMYVPEILETQDQLDLRPIRFWISEIRNQDNL